MACMCGLQVLKETLLRHGFTFESETDTEVIPKLAKFVFDKANEEGIIFVCNRILIVYQPKRLICCRMGPEIVYLASILILRF